MQLGACSGVCRKPIIIAMFLRIPPLLLITGLIIFAAPIRAGALDLYVSTRGSDTASGTAPEAAGDSGPFATLQRARDEIRRLKASQSLKEGVTVYVRGGVYELPETLTLEAQDAGTEGMPIAYRAFRNEKPTLTGGRTVTGFEPYKGAILKADLTNQKLKGISFRQLYFEGKRQWLARYPNADAAHPISGGWAYADGDPIPIYKEIPGENKHTLIQRAGDVRTWSRPEEGEVFVFARYNWWNNEIPIKSVDRETRTITLKSDASYAVRPHDRYYISNLFEELDAPGEWYLDKRTSTLFFIPPEPLTGKSVSVPVLSTVIEMKPGAAWLTVRGFTIECAAGDSVVLKNTEHCLVAGNTIRNCGGMRGGGVSVSGGHDNGVAGNDISEIGNSGINLSGGDRATLAPAGNYADNNYIHHIGLCYKQGVGISLYGVGNRASHNLIHDGPRFAILFGGNNQVIENNHFRHVALETEDVGATYCGGRDWISPRGSIIRYNYIHDILGFARVTKGNTTEWVSPHFSWGIYLDDNSGAVDVIGNIVARCGRALFHSHDARDCVIENNIFVDGGEQQWEMNGWNVSGKFWKELYPKIALGYESMVNEPAWKGKRGMQVHPKDIADAEGRVMCGNVFTRNIIAWTKPEAKALHVAEFNPARNTVDRNLYWNGGRSISTGLAGKAGKALSANLVVNGGFEADAVAAMPAGWSWQIRPRRDATATVAPDGGGKCLRIDAALVAGKSKDNYPIVSGQELELTPGGTYRLRARMRSDADSAKAALMVECWNPPANGRAAHFWSSNPNSVNPTQQWKLVEFTLTVPEPGKPGWDDRMQRYRVRIDWPEASGSLFVDDVVLEKVEALGEWAAWQDNGSDRHSVIADPKFRDRAKDDYRLEKNSPAWALGFKPIPMEKIGPYADPLRASWPIIEAPGARERLPGGY